MAAAVPAPLKWGLTLLALLCAGLSAFWFSLLLSSDPLPGLRIEGRPTPTSAAALARSLTERAETWAAAEIEVSAEGTLGATRVPRAALGAQLPTRAILASAQAVGRSGNPLLDLGKWWAARRGEIDLHWTARVARAPLIRFVESEQLRIEELPIAGVSDGHGYNLPGREGRALDMPAALATLQRALGLGLRGPNQVVLRVQRIPSPAPIPIGSPDGALFDEEPGAQPSEPAISAPIASVRAPERWRPANSDDCYSNPPQRPFCDGPRRVPLPHGEGLTLAQALGLGQLDTVGQLIHRGPRAEWVRAAEGGAESSLWPVPAGRLGRGFGYVRRPELRDRIHAGVDIVAPAGSQIVASRSGLVAYSDNRVRGYGNLLVIVHGNGDVTLSAHCQRIFVFAGERVARGQVVAEVGMTGLALGPHLHFELRVAGQPTDPQPNFQLAAEARGSAREPNSPRARRSL